MPEGMSFKENIVNFAPDGISGGAASSPGSDPEAEKRNRAEREYNERKGKETKFGREGQAFEDLLRNAETKAQVQKAVKVEIDIYNEKTYYPESAKSPYLINELVSQCRDRAKALRLTTNEIVSLGIASNVKKDANGRLTGEAKFGGFAIRTSRDTGDVSKARRIPHEVEVDEVTKEVLKTRYVLDYPEVSDYGTETERKSLAEAHENGAVYLEVNKALSDQHTYYTQHTEDIDGLAQFYLFSLPSNEGMNVLFNYEGEPGSATKTKGGVDYRPGHEYGDKVDAAIRLYTLIAMSEKKEEIIKLMNSPFFELLFDSADPDFTTNVESWIGNPGKFRLDETGRERDVYSNKKEVIAEGEKKIRGELTKYGNIFLGVAGDDYSKIWEIRNAVRRFIGNSENEDDACRAEALGLQIFQLWYMASEMGWETYKGKLGLKRNHDMGNPMTDDFCKIVHPDIFQEIYTDKVRDAGPKVSRGKYPRFSVSFLRAISIEDDKGQTRSLWEKWVGYKQDNIGPKEPALRIGELPWKKFVPKILNKFYLSGFMAGRKEIGIYQHITNSSWESRTFEDPTFWEKLNKYIGVGVSPAVVANGIFRGKNIDELKNDETPRFRKDIIRNFRNGTLGLPQAETWAAGVIKKVKNGKGAFVKEDNPMNYHEDILEKSEVLK